VQHSLVVFAAAMLAILTTPAVPVEVPVGDDRAKVSPMT
jgi:hypothetical protein